LHFEIQYVNIMALGIWLYGGAQIETHQAYANRLDLLTGIVIFAEPSQMMMPLYLETH
jgi:hypothetical protein